MPAHSRAACEAGTMRVIAASAGESRAPLGGIAQGAGRRDRHRAHRAASGTGGHRPAHASSRAV
ncbi:hypothetical protein BSIN_1931 [Burkholderia singularis]|uniref:Uncharacterized protein n=1 Tax=Burkholderia singularis TaxID=1503053 RepID=A0A238H0A5_9BURK|nr:hypothetical protein BSIN_1931 [Burkholderia singularis]